MKFHIFSIIVPISYCSLVSATGLTRGLFSGSLNDAQSYNHTASVDIDTEDDDRKRAKQGDDSYPEDRGAPLSLVSVYEPNRCLQPKSLMRKALVEVSKCLENTSYKERQGWNFVGRKLRPSQSRDLCLTVQSDRQNFLKLRLNVDKCGKPGDGRNRKVLFHYYPNKRHLRWVENEKYYVTQIGKHLYLRKFWWGAKAKRQNWVFFRGWAQPTMQNISKPNRQPAISPSKKNTRAPTPPPFVYKPTVCGLIGNRGAANERC